MPRCASKCRWTYETSGWDHIAAIAPVVIACAAVGDAKARSILDSGADEIADSAAAVLERLSAADVVTDSQSANESIGAAQLPIVLCGGLLSDPQNTIYCEAVCSRLRMRFPQHTLVTPNVDAEFGAALLACQEVQRQTT